MQNEMRRETDVRMIVNSHYRAMRRFAQTQCVKQMPMRTIIHWSEGPTSEFDCQLPRLAVQEILSGTAKISTESSFGDKLRQYGITAICSPRPPGVAPQSVPGAISVSVDALMASEVKWIDSSRQFIVAGRSVNGSCHCRLVPMALHDDEGFLVFGIPVPSDLDKQLKAVKDLTMDFMQPFFSGVNEATHP